MQRIEKGRDLDRDLGFPQKKSDFGKLGRPTKCGTKFTRNGKIFVPIIVSWTGQSKVYDPETMAPNRIPIWSPWSSLML